MSGGADRAATVALVALPRMGPARMRRLLARHGSPGEAWAAVEQGTVALDDVGGAAAERGPLAASWRDAARRRSPEEWLDVVHAAGHRVITRVDAEWPSCFETDPEPPDVLFVTGSTAALEGPCVAIIGTRRCTSAGTSIARELGRDLGAAGVGVISGLALGIDGAAHRGTLDGDGTPIGVVATGLDIVYPRRHQDLWHAVADRGVVLSEAAPGTTAERWRFPARNRIMASLADIVVVVESNTTGGSMLTVDSAIERDTEVMAVPGSPRVAASRGPNQLLADGCGVVRDADDVLMALGFRASPPAASVPSESLDPVADAISFPPIALDRLVAETGLAFGAVASRLVQLEAAGVIERVGEGYQRRVR